ncbi:molybdopterin-dependent oxidoreductase, partial [uncultured Candidatus Puniceispirillum sp.]|uniref:molybdopterin-dependent oxidoreductase n=1 Tax=uncultured Candidatus Puniceispirillum sp. TaxID=1985115 RepID=UPI0032B16CE6
GMYKAAENKKLDFVWLLGADEVDIDRLDGAFVVYQGHHGDKGAHGADVVLPGAAYTEKDGIYVNTEGRVQYSNRAAFPPGEAREDWAIIRAFSGHINKTIGMDSLSEVREALCEAYPHFAEGDAIANAKWSKFGGRGKMDATPITNSLDDFHMTCAISRASETMAECRKALLDDTVDETAISSTVAAE